MWPCSGSVDTETKLRDSDEKSNQKPTWTMSQMKAYIKSEWHVQEKSNSIINAIEKARSRAASQQESEPPLLEDLTEELLMPEVAEARSLSASESVSRIWDTGASKGMTQVGSTSGVKVPGPTTKISTGNGVVASKVWYNESLPVGVLRHVGLEATQDTISAGQANAQTGVQTSWISPEPIPSLVPGPVVLHEPAEQSGDADIPNHIIWEGSHRILIPSIVANTPELADSQRFRTISGRFCATPGCRCPLKKLTSVIEDHRGFPAAVEAQAEVEAEAKAANGAGADVASVANEDEDNGDEFHVEQRKSALYSLSGYKCTCPLCAQAKQRRNFPLSDAHPHSEATCRQTPGMHGYSDTPSYFFLVDYGPDQWFCGQARYDLFGFNPATNAWLCQTVKDKSEATCLASCKSSHGPSENMSKLSIRRDNANDLLA